MAKNLGGMEKDSRLGSQNRNRLTDPVPSLILAANNTAILSFFAQ